MVKPGYKQTEIGIIPKDWTVANFGSKVKIFRGGSPRPIQDYLTQADDGVNWIKIGDVREGDKYITSTEEKIIPEGVSRSRTVHAGDFILSNSMSFGRPYILNIDGCIHDGWLTIQEYEQTFSKDFLYYLLSSDSVYQQYISMAAGSSVKNLNKEKVSALMVAYPEIGEQEKIAEALSCIDTLIAYSEKELAKKKAIKQGAMQELLTGKKRLPGFSEKWESNKLHKCTERIIVGLATSVTQYYRERGTVIFRNLNILPNKLDDRDILYLDPDFANTYPNKKVKANDVLTVHTGYVGISCLVPPKYEGALTFTTLITTTKKDVLSPAFLVAHLNSPIGTKTIEALQAGGGRNNLNVSDFEQYELFFPQDVAEQEAIAEVLSNMDSEIEALEQKLAKTRQIKQGMMQQLLTGKIRLV